MSNNRKVAMPVRHAFYISDSGNEQGFFFLPLAVIEMR
jgi:hypothetical protein